MYKLILSQAACLFFLVFSAVSQDKWTKADIETPRLSPKMFTQLPASIVSHLEKRRCTVPQSFAGGKPHNVISGEFIKRGQSDWAVLCSINRTSSILIFVGGSVSNVLKIAESQDSGFLQTIDGDGTVGFSRQIGVVDGAYIEDHYREYGGPKPPPITHSGIEDAFLEKASTIHYYHRGKWLALQGAD